MKRKTKIIATIGPASLNQEIFKSIIEEGVDYVRVNTAYSDKKQFEIIFDNLKKITNKDVKIIFDIRSVDTLKNIIEYNPSSIALSFSESAEQINSIINMVPDCKIISKIESKKGVENFDEILNASWGTMIARGDLGEAVSLEKVPCLQRNLTKKTIEKNKFLIVATEMLLSMTENKKPTRAEVSDVANAVFDGASAVMLSEETAIGKNPIESVVYMRKIIEDAEKCI